MKLLIFDIDGTLTSLDGATYRAYSKAFLEVFGREPVTEGLSMHGRTDPLIFRECFERTGLRGDWRQGYDEFKPRYLAHLPEAISSSPRAKVHAGVRELLDSLRSKPTEFALALGTGNMEPGARAKIGHFGLNKYFPVGGFGDIHEERYLIMRDAVAEAAQHYNYNFEPEMTWVIGDTAFDVEGARQAGLRSLAVATGGKYSIEMLRQTGADAVVENLSDTQEILGLFV